MLRETTEMLMAMGISGVAGPVAAKMTASSTGASG